MPSGAKTRYIVRWASGNKIYWGIKTGCNEAFVIDEKKRAELISADPNSAEIIKPLAIGDDVRRWHVRDKKRYLIVTRIGVDIQRYPAIFAHLSQYEERLRARSDQGNHWWELRSCDYYDAFDKPKIIYPSICTGNRFSYTDLGWFSNDKTFFLGSTDLFLLGFLNSKYCWKYLESVCSSIQGGALELRRIYMSQLPVPIMSEDAKQAIELLVEICLDGAKEDTKEAESKIDKLFGEFYGF